MQTLAEWNIDVAVVAEPYAILARDNWAGDRRGSVALISLTANGSPPFETVVRGQGWVKAEVDGTAIIGIYCSPNDDFADFERVLAELEALIGQVYPRPVLVAGDFNAKSTAWGSPATDVRGETLEEWASALGLQLLNRGNENTCVRYQGSSIVDLTFASAPLARRVHGWRVVTDTETLSDHRYIRFQVSASTTITDGARALIREGRRWVLAGLNQDIAKEAAIVEMWMTETCRVIEDVDEEARRISTALERVCDASMPLAKPSPPRRWVYWWRAELRGLRRACVVTRRLYARSKRRRIRDRFRENVLYEEYRAACKALQIGITDAKEASWVEWLDTLNRDPWGRPYRVIRAKFRPWAPPLTSSLQPHLIEQVVTTLFPSREPWVPPPMPSGQLDNDNGLVSPVSEAELTLAMIKLRSKKTAPGLDGVPGRVLAIAFGEMGEWARSLFTACLNQGRFPGSWKVGKLVLLRKDGRPADHPSAYRPIVLLDEVSKLFERVLTARLVRCMSPDLHPTQFGFRRGRSTIEAIGRVKELAEEAMARGGVLLAVSLDISNAFNTLPWETVIVALQFHRVPRYLQAVIADYFVGRAITYPAKFGWERRVMECGVPQGSVLGPLLWNIGFDYVLRGANLRGVEVTCYADDTLVTAFGASYREAAVRATAGVAQVVRRIRSLGLEVALHKSEALLFHEPRDGPPPGAQIMVGGTAIPVGKSMKYLGLVLDGRWRFEEHFRRLAPRLVAAAGKLSSILPNIGGPGATCRRLYTGVIRSMALYGAPIWAGTINARTAALLHRPQRTMCIRMVRAYRTVSFVGASLLAGLPPWDLEAESLATVYWRRLRAREGGEDPPPRIVTSWRDKEREVTLRKWEERLSDPLTTRELVAAIRPLLKQWVERKHGVLSYHLTQLLTGHGCFGGYLCEVVGREPTPACHHCGAPMDTAAHTFQACPAWNDARAAVLTELKESTLSLKVIISAMTSSEDKWQLVVEFAKNTMARKEEAERERERQDALPIRRRRAGRRKAAYMAQQP